jgi:hypothetical protein
MHGYGEKRDGRQKKSGLLQKTGLRSGKFLLDGTPHSSIAQLVERSTVNRMVAGSSPARGAKLFLLF